MLSDIIKFYNIKHTWNLLIPNLYNFKVNYNLKLDP